MIEPRRYRRRKLTFEQVNEIKAKVSAGTRQKDVAGEYGVDTSTVNKIVKGHTRRTDSTLPSVEAVKAGNKRRQADWRKANAAHVKLACKLGQHTLRGVGRVTASEWIEALDVFDGRCAYCGVRDKMAVEHVIPISAGGANDISNVVPACGSCNFVKGRSGPLAMVNRKYELRDA